MRGQTTCAVDVSPDVVDAGAEMTLRGKVSCSPACDLRGHTLLIKDQAGADAGSIELTEFDGETNETNEFVVKAPVSRGIHVVGRVSGSREGRHFIHGSVNTDFVHGQASHDECRRVGHTIGYRGWRKIQDQGRDQVLQRVPPHEPATLESTTTRGHE